MFSHIGRLWLVVAISSLTLGCSSGPSTGSVTGTVTYDGAPVKAGTIAFVAADGIPRHADIQSDGTYRVDNVPVGEAIIVINPPPVEDPNKHMRIKEQKDAPRAQTPPPPFPSKYYEMATSDLRYVVKSGANVYQAEMKR